jgi:2-C-methyl-D-erythritol 4-phosphate cytidylyltransferase
MKEYVIIVAAGSGKRMGAAIPKQFLQLAGKPILLHTMEKFLKHNPNIGIVLVLNAEYVAFWQELCHTLNIQIKHEIVCGGKERFHSVKNGLDAITEEDAIVAIHDAVRPLVSLKTIENCFLIACEKGAAVPVLHLTDSLRITSNEGSAPVDRGKYRMVQTPQCFQINLLRQAYEQPFNDSFTDDASVVEAFGEHIHLLEGNREIIKITDPVDLRMAEAMLMD